MHRIFKTVLAAAAVLMGTQVLAQTTSTNRYDINGDGKLTGRDLDGFANMAGKTSEPATMSMFPRSDLNGDKVIDIKDWREFVIYALEIGGRAEVLFDFNGNGKLDVADRDVLADYLGRAAQNQMYDMRLDFNYNGVANAADWKVFLDYAKRARPEVLLQHDGNGKVDGYDLYQLSELISRFTTGVASGYLATVDLDGDGKITTGDWRAAVALAQRVDQRALFDVHASLNPSLPMLDLNDTAAMVIAVNGQAMFGSAPLRYDLNGDGVVNKLDWTEYVNFVTSVYRKPALVFDVDRNGVVNATDVSLVSAAISSSSVERTQYDVNGDGQVNSYDVLALNTYLKGGVFEPMLGDVNRDGCVNLKDYQLVQTAQGSSPQSSLALPSLYDFELDVDRNYTINGSDLTMLNTNMNKCQ